MVALLATHVKKPDEYEWVKLKRLLKYLKGESKLKITLSVGDMPVVNWWYGASYTVYKYCLRHMGGMLSLVKVSVSSLSTKQKINGKRSTEDELICVDIAMDKILWPKYFIEAQGYKIFHKNNLQDNKSATFLEKILIYTATNGIHA